MNFKPSPMQVLFMFNLLFKGGESWMREIKPELKPVIKRKQLVKEGFIEEEKKKTEKGSFALFDTVTDKGWSWADENLDAEFSWQSNASKFALKFLLSKLKFFKSKYNYHIVDLLCASEMNMTEELTSSDLEKKVKDAYYRAADNQWNVRVRLHDLRLLLPGIPRVQLDDLLLGMQERGKAVLYNMDDVFNITPEDEKAAIIIGDFPRHILYMEK